MILIFEYVRKANEQKSRGGARKPATMKKISFRICLWAKLAEWKYEKRTFYFAFKTRAFECVCMWMIMFLPIYLRAGSSQALMMQRSVVVGMEIRLERFAMYEASRHPPKLLYFSPSINGSVVVFCASLYMRWLLSSIRGRSGSRVCKMKSKEVFQESSPHTPFPTIFSPSRHRHLLRRK